MVELRNSKERLHRDAQRRLRHRGFSWCIMTILGRDFDNTVTQRKQDSANIEMHPCEIGHIRVGVRAERNFVNSRRLQVGIRQTCKVALRLCHWPAYSFLSIFCLRNYATHSNYLFPRSNSESCPCSLSRRSTFIVQDSVGL